MSAQGIPAASQQPAFDIATGNPFIGRGTHKTILDDIVTIDSQIDLATESFATRLASEQSRGQQAVADLCVGIFGLCLEQRTKIESNAFQQSVISHEQASRTPAKQACANLKRDIERLQNRVQIAMTGLDQDVVAARVAEHSKAMNYSSAQTAALATALGTRIAPLSNAAARAPSPSFSPVNPGLGLSQPAPSKPATAPTNLAAAAAPISRNAANISLSSAKPAAAPSAPLGLDALQEGDSDDDGESHSTNAAAAPAFRAPSFNSDAYVDALQGVESDDEDEPNNAKPAAASSSRSASSAPSNSKLLNDGLVIRHINPQEAVALLGSSTQSVDLHEVTGKATRTVVEEAIGTAKLLDCTTLVINPMQIQEFALASNRSTDRRNIEGRTASLVYVAKECLAAVQATEANLGKINTIVFAIPKSAPEDVVTIFADQFSGHSKLAAPVAARASAPSAASSDWEEDEDDLLARVLYESTLETKADDGKYARSTSPAPVVPKHENKRSVANSAPSDSTLGAAKPSPATIAALSSSSSASVLAQPTVSAAVTATIPSNNNGPVSSSSSSAATPSLALQPDQDALQLYDADEDVDADEAPQPQPLQVAPAKKTQAAPAKRAEAFTIPAGPMVDLEAQRTSAELASLAAAAAAASQQKKPAPKRSSVSSASAASSASRPAVKIPVSKAMYRPPANSLAARSTSSSRLSAAVSRPGSAAAPAKRAGSTSAAPAARTPAAKPAPAKK